MHVVLIDFLEGALSESLKQSVVGFLGQTRDYLLFHVLDIPLHLSHRRVEFGLKRDQAFLLVAPIHLQPTECLVDLIAISLAGHYVRQSMELVPVHFLAEFAHLSGQSSN